MPRIFISYRRSDSPDIAGHIYESFAARFGKKNVFKDVDTIPVGTDFHADIEAAIIKSHIMLVIIGPGWLNATDKQGKRRLDDPEDLVRKEVELGLRHRLKVIPVLVNGAQMPSEDDLPRRLAILSPINAATIRNAPDFERDMERFIRAIAPRRTWLWIVALAVVLIAAAAISLAAFIATRSVTPTPIEAALISTGTSETPTFTKITPTETRAALVLEASPSETLSPTHTNTATATDTAVPSHMPSAMATTTATHTNTPLPTATDTVTNTNTPAPSATSTPTNSWTPTFTQTSSFTPTQTPSAASSPMLTLVPTLPPTVTSEGLSGFAPITADNAKDLEIGYVVDGQCVGLDSTDTLLITSTGVYDIASGQRYSHSFKARYFGRYVLSRDRTRVAVSGDGVYDIVSGERKPFYISSATPVFSPDGSLLAVNGSVYDVATGEKKPYAIGTSTPVFSPDGSLLAIGRDGVYDVATGEKKPYAIDSGTPVFSPDGSLLAVSDSVYDVATGEKKPYSIGTGTHVIGTGTPVFSPDGSLLAVSGSVYDIATGEKKPYSIGTGTPVFSPDGSLLAVSGSVYDIATGEKKPYSIGTGTPVFSPDGTLLVSPDGIFRISDGQLYSLNAYGSYSLTSKILLFSTGRQCLVMGITQSPSFAEQLIVTNTSANIRTTPAANGDIAIAAGVPSGTLLHVVGTSEGNWYRVDDNQWIWGGGVTPLLWYNFVAVQPPP